MIKIPCLKYFLLPLLLLTVDRAWAQVVPLPGAHAHNDYKHNRPLLDAVAHGFTSIEVDILLIDGEIYVGHDMPTGAHSLPTLTDAYLQPLDSIIRQNGGNLYPNFEQPCYLMIDIKTEAEKTFSLLREQLLPYASWIRKYENGKTGKGAIVIFLSGNRPYKAVLSDPKGLVSLDGRPADLGKGYGSHQMPVISQAFYRYSKWDGEEQMPKADQQRISDLAGKVHREHKKFRLWATPDSEKAWETLQSLGVDLINTDDLGGLKAYLLKE
ncbi:hypothetical protein QQ020_14710 [Fulvivirgaceae bacterium BMA12]|uniref:Altered inheritance of mitochondria protein 6 n=1 Tax=Agaribacillus aureus TaxID=3051825 RepID=A0ABT8LAL3_9BACT|nr:hypothetical protein [Fulvivirgaceae bacterium BMA12]